MKVILLAPTPPPAGGIAGWTERMLKAHLNRGWEISVVDEKVLGNRGVFGKKNKRNYFKEIKRCIRIWNNLKLELKDNDSRVVHSCIPSLPLAMLREYICAIITHRRGRRFIIHFRCTVPNTTHGKISLIILNKLCNIADYIIVLNYQSKVFLETRTKKPIVIIPNFIDESEIFDSRVINQHINKILYVGGVVEDKGISDLIQVAKSFPDIEFRIVGDGDESYKKNVAELNIKNVVFTGPKNKEEIKKELHEADVFMFLTFFYGEGFSNALCEAMASGLPCIVTDWAANRDMICDAGGVVVNIRDVDSTIKAVNSIMDKSIREKMSKSNIEKVMKYYIDNVVINKYVEVYEKACE